MEKIGLVTVLYNGALMLEGFVSSVASQEFPARLYAVDNASTDGSANLLERLAASSGVDVVIIRNDQNAGVAAANNQGIEAALRDGCGWIILLNNDIEFSRNVFGCLVAVAEETGADMVAPKVSIHGTGKIWYAGGSFSPFKGVNDHWHYGKPLEVSGLSRLCVSYAPTCFVLCRSGVFRLAGMMDERYFVYFDDTDFMFRARKAGLSLVYEPSVVISHKVSGSTGGETSDFSLRYLNRNRVFFLVKSYSGLVRLLYYAVFRLSLLPRFLRLNVHKRRIVVDAIAEGFKLAGTAEKDGAL